ncbi:MULTISPECIES: stage V sporulation protein AD [Thermoactinomyces]|jgi:stage V sporulation protein AD|uniref:Stage V sporulation protein AD n=1 Tax=Thermoactinomyces daqus TaxID=1329516 RepID=A0A7W1X7Y9_9BACL|nr:MULTISPECIES: stage V sporulation protein AD [Thermoactinomyces]MBA4541758.1 stage V sporulation protein AD [Thermoactinomyces daqus]MBH8597156.1 stage V sporulation protein AD [Thermoactinomyces sp. CICC 10523]MBH8602716.1 stage V sporulation protein AD [Thermoactinomyces sp. CICC 10522]MBH8606173.1 stage V sporulation protein AD [Thermoactinomyces sp. CICC 10521]
MTGTKLIGKSTWEFQNDVRVLSSAATVGPMEGEGLLRESFDKIYPDLYAGEETWEKAERKMLEDAVSLAIEKAGLTPEQIDFYLAGDLLNQNISASFSAKTNQIPFLGVYGACSTSMLSLALAAVLVDGGYARHVIAGVSSHNCTAEKQYRYPTEYGGQKPETAQWTVTGAGACLLGRSGDGPVVRYATVGKVTDLGVKNPMDMGSAMAPAAAQTIQAHFADTGRSPEDYDLIVTGDLAKVGLPIARELLKNAGFEMGEHFADCGLMIYTQKQETFAGGSGCACSAVVTYGHLLREMMRNKWKRILVVATGALLSTVSYQQGEAIPCIAHAVAFEMEEGKEGKA